MRTPAASAIVLRKAGWPGITVFFEFQDGRDRITPDLVSNARHEFDHSVSWYVQTERRWHCPVPSHWDVLSYVPLHNTTAMIDVRCVPVTWLCLNRLLMLKRLSIFSELTTVSYAHSTI